LKMRLNKNFKKIFPARPGLNIMDAFLTFIYAIVFTKILNRPSPRGPLFVTWLVTYECNVFCGFCSTHRLKQQFPEEISLQRAREIAHEIAKAKTYAVGFTGGEVLLWPHLFEVIQILKKHNVAVYIVTNGLLLKEKTDEIIKSGVDYITVSIDSDVPGEHDRVRNFPMLYKKILEGIEYLKCRRKSKWPLIKSTTIIHRDNLQNLCRIVKNLDSIVDVTSVQPIVGGYAHGPHGKSDETLQALIFRQDEQESVDRVFHNLIHENDDFDNEYFRLIPRYWFSKETLAEKIHCWSPFLRLQILPNGEVFHCTANERYPAAGNLKKSSILEIWNSPEMIRQREEIRLHNNHCICWAQDTSFNAIINNVPCSKKLPIFNLK